MKITEFLKRHSLINSKFIDDFYSFYDEGKNEYDYTVDLEKLAFWLEVRKEHLKDLLVANFTEGDDYIELEKKQNGKGIGRGKNNRKIIMLRYTCAKEICMISRTHKSSVIRKFYIDIEKLLITYKESIVRDINNQLGIKETNKDIIDKDKNKGLIYVLKLNNGVYKDDEPIEVKIGSTEDIDERMKQYNVGRINELPIVFVYLTDHINEIETCIKQNLKKYQLKYRTETFKIDLDFIKETIKYCSLSNAVMLQQNKKLLDPKNKQKGDYFIIIDRERLDRVDDLLLNVKKIRNKEKPLELLGFKTANKDKKGSKKGSKLAKTSKGSKLAKTSKSSKKGSKLAKTSKSSKKGSKLAKTSKSSKKGSKLAKTSKSSKKGSKLAKTSKSSKKGSKLAKTSKGSK